MPRLIDADALCDECIEKLYMLSCEHCVIRDFKLYKAIEAEPVRHRNWVVKTHDDGYGEYEVKHCPDCDRGLPTEYDASYCPKCGAKMDGKGDENDAT